MDALARNRWTDCPGIRTRLGQGLNQDIHLVSDYPGCTEITNNLFNEICRKRRIFNKTRSKEALKLIILNLWVASKTGLPIKYHRRHSAYTHLTRYGKLHLKYSKAIPTIDDLLKMGLIEHAIGFLGRAKDVGRISRISPSENVVRLFPMSDLEDPCFLGWADNKDTIQFGEPKIVKGEAKMAGGKGIYEITPVTVASLIVSEKSGSLDLKKYLNKEIQIMENLENTFEENETETSEFYDEEVAKKRIITIVEDIRQRAQENLLTDDYAVDALKAMDFIMLIADLHPEECRFEMDAVQKLFEELPPFLKASHICDIVSMMRYTRCRGRPIDRGFIIASMARLEKLGMTSKQIRMKVNKHLRVTDRKAFRKFLDGLRPTPAVLAITKELTKMVMEVFDGIQSKPVSHDDAHKLIDDYKSHWTEHLLKTKSLSAAVTFQKGDKRVSIDLFFTNYNNKPANLEIFRSVAQAIQPDAIVTVVPFWKGSSLEFGQKIGDSTYWDLTDSWEKEAIVFIVETPTDYWRAVQRFSRNGDGEIVLDRNVLSLPIKNPYGSFIFLRNTSDDTTE